MFMRPTDPQSSTALITAARTGAATYGKKPREHKIRMHKAVQAKCIAVINSA